jgi:hypothetical protein
MTPLTEDHTHRIYVHNTDMHGLVIFEPTIPAFERAKTVYAIDRTTNVIGEIDIAKRKVSNIGLYCLSFLNY